ncbi:MAG TPA: serine/threonine-protein kinase, partial [Gemmatimonadales bacterium]|nr:serine/threonine-protein kinase [Gemmatimonadales bacterium]
MKVVERLGAALADRYEVRGEIGHGGMARVYQARDLRHAREVAIKVLHPELAAALGADRFHHEIRIAAGLLHPNIVPLLDSGEAAGLLYFVMPFVPGETLRARIERERQLPLAEAVAITSQAAAALEYAHRQGVIHRDIKPENILLLEGQAVVADFGVARAIDTAGGDRVTSSGFVVGTPAYMSPEQAAADPSLDGRTDEYSLGCVTYEMLAGRPPFVGATAQAISALRLTTIPPPIRAMREGVPEPVDAAIFRAIARSPADRHGGPGPFAAALRAASAVPGPDTVPMLPPTGTRAPRRLGWVLPLAL